MGRTKPFVLDKWFHNDFEEGTEDSYTMEAEDVGELLMIKLENDQGGLYSDWFVEKVVINSSRDPEKLYEFPCGRWVQSESVFFEGKGRSADTDDIRGVFHSTKTFGKFRNGSR